MFIAMFKTQMKPRVVSLQSFEHFDFIAMVDKSTDHWKVVFDLFFYNNLDGFEVVIFRKNARARKKKYKLHLRHVIFMVCTLIDHSSPTSFPGFSLLRKPWERG